jgi:hypothetical protein
MNEVCEHGHLARVCEVCELKAEVLRLRETCDRVAKWLRRKYEVMRPGSQMRAEADAVILELEREGSKSDGN